MARRGFERHSLSDIVREEAAARGLPPERAHLIRIGTLLRKEIGAGVLGERMLPRLGAWAVVDSIRNPAEVAVLRRLPKFVLLGVRAPLEVRFMRSLERDRRGDPVTLAEFEARERQENTEDPQAQQLDATFALSDWLVDNDGNLQRLHRALDDLLLDRGPDQDGSG
ncbi:MAG: hypothetical protein ACREDF_09780 [Thermoplasmata archaeon]